MFACEDKKIEESEMWLHQLSSGRRLTAGKNVSSWGGKTAWMLVCRAYTKFLTADFK
jgi:hypothetical protein